MSAAGRLSAPGGRRRPRADLGFLLVGPLAVAWTTSTLFTGYGALAELAGAVLAAAAVVLAVAARTRRLDLLAVASVAGFAGYALVTLFGPLSTHGPFGVRAFTVALRSGWSALLSTGIPADPEAALLTAPVMLVWLTTAVAVALAVTSRSALPALVPVLAGFAAALALAAVRGGTHLPAAAVLGLSALGFALVRSEQAGPAGPAGADTPRTRGGATAGESPPGRALRGRLLLGLPVVIIAVALGTAAAAVVPTRDPADPRALRQPPVSISQELNPLVEVRGQLTATPARRLGTVRLASSTGQLPVDRVTTAILGDFDGARWRNTNVFVRAGAVPPAGGLAPVDPAVTVRAEITVEALGSPLLPVVGWPTRLTGAALAIDPETGTLLAAGTPANAYRYQLTAAVPAPDRTRLAAALPGSGEGLAEYLTVPTGLPPDLVAVAAAATAAAGTPYEQLTALERFLRDPARFPYDLSGRPGQSYGSLNRMLTSLDPREQRGYAEQHAAAFALLARVRGFPSRIAVGYLLGPDRAGGPGVYEISQTRAHAWPEVYLDGIGWLPFEPTDTTDLARQDQVDAASAEGDGAAPPEPAESEPPLPRVDPIPLLAPPSSGGGGPVRSALLAFLILLILLLVVLPAAIVGEKRRRRWRRRVGGPPAQRIAGAWQEARDRLWDWGVPPDRSRTATEVVEDARALGDPVADVLARLAALMAATMFARPQPALAARAVPDVHAAGVGGGVAAGAGAEVEVEVEVEVAWALVADLRGQLRAGRPITRRSRAALNARPLLGRNARRRRSAVHPDSPPADYAGTSRAGLPGAPSAHGQGGLT
ncbi:transglutaminase-like enzyme, predicted cysteine protease [Frankia sp. EI5c]|uniref:DUF3488 and transglutaminase-like domain-containing protein n=1 Tax=Frankia sp. EI5c TaxID=683316 RepID=UPI0007C269FA|nr:transglutaminase domain-containing protein [Frankia sp. EI5c]OAA25215.1 transglutaminase-like enzyme, predicted cysteine protease [Frankia sp. EI5c]